MFSVVIFLNHTMKKLIFISILIFFLAGIAFAQQQSEIPKLDINPDPFVETNKVIDSIVQYTYPEQNDSSFLHKWLYNHFKDGGSHEAVMYYWNPAFRAWSPPLGKYVYAFDPEGRLQVQSHYTYRYSNGTWKGCDSDGCGKKEWVYDTMGNQILWTQSYWNRNVRDWWIYQIKENLYDWSGNMVLESSKYRDQSYDLYWYGGKNEFSYDGVGNQTGHVSYGWSGGDPYDWRPNYKEERSFDGNGNITKYVIYSWQGGWTGRTNWYGSTGWAMVEFKYDSDARKRSVLLYKWDSVLNDWILDIEEESVLDAYGRLISEMGIQFTDYAMINPARKEYAYNESGEKISEITTSWIDWVGSWRDRVKNEYTYDSLGRKVQDIASNWDGQTQSWLKSRKNEFAYDPAGNQVLYIISNWNSDLNEWMGYGYEGKQEWAFDSSGNEVLYVVYDWDTGKKDWVGSLKTEHEYDKSGKMILLARYGWDNKAGEWKGDGINGKKEWGYNSNGQLISETEYLWNTEDTDWQEKIKLTVIYNSDGDPAEYRQSWWNPDLGKWEKVLRYFFHYKSGVTGKPEIIANNIQLYPNPTEGQITISGLSLPTDIMLYSIQGQLLKTYTGVTGGIDISDLPTGVYLLKLTWGNNAIVKKTVIKK